MAPFRVETTFKFIAEALIEVYGPKDWKCRESKRLRNLKSKRLNKNRRKVSLLFFDFLIKRRLNSEERQEKLKIEEEGLEEGCESEGRKLFRARSSTVKAPNCIRFKLRFFVS